MKTAAADGQVLRRIFQSRATLYSLFLASIIFSVPAAAAAQYDPSETAPPPVKVVSKDEKARLNAAKDVKERTKLALEMMSSRLASAEQSLGYKDFDNVFRELGCFQGLLDDQLEYMIRTDNDSGRALDNFKRLELGLRGFVPRIETIRRSLPLRYEPFVRGVGKYVRDARSKALEPLFSDSVVQVPKRSD